MKSAGVGRKCSHPDYVTPFQELCAQLLKVVFCKQI